MALAPVVAGVSEHLGWAILVCISVQDRAPEVMDRRRVELIDPGLPKHPYEHETIGMSATEAERLVCEVRESAAHCAERALSRLRSDLGTTSLSIALRTPPLPRLPNSVAEAHASSHVTVRADGMLYHDALCTSAASLGIDVTTFPRGEERQRAAEAMATTVDRVDQFLGGLRASLGPPWQQDHQTATARALIALGQRTTLQLHKSRKL